MNGRIKRPEGSSDRLAFPRIGKVRIGKKGANGYPQSVDYFIPTGKYAGLFTAAYGDKPQTIQIIFTEDDPAKVCRERYEYRDNSGHLIAHGDGEIFAIWNGTSYQELSIIDHPNLMTAVANRYPNAKTKKGGDGWDIILTLNFIIPLIRGVAGIWTFETKGSASTIPHIRDTFDAMLAQRGFCKGIIFDLNVQFATSQSPGNASRFPVVSLVPNESKDNINLIKEALEPVKSIKESNNDDNKRQ